jgi:hypothetical protein
MAVGQPRIARADFSSEVRRQPEHVGEVQRARVHTEHGRDDVPRHAHRRETGVGEARPQAGDLVAGVRLGLAAGRGPPMRPREGVLQDRAEVRQVGHAEGAPEIARPDHAAAGQHTDREGAGVVVAGGLGLAFRRCDLFSVT